MNLRCSCNILLTFSSYTLRLQPIVAHPRCYTADSSPFTAEFPLVTRCGSPKLAVTCGTRSRRPHKPGIGLDLIYVGKDF